MTLKLSLQKFVNQKGTPVDRLTNSSQLNRYLKGEWFEKYKGIAGEPGLFIHKETQLWHFRITVQKKRRHFTFGSYPSVSLNKAKERAQRTRKSLKNGNVIYEEELQEPDTPPLVVVEVPIQKRKERFKDRKRGPKDQTVNDLIQHYLDDYYNDLKKRQTNKQPFRSLQRLINLYKRHVKDYLGALLPKEIRNSDYIAVLSAIRDSSTTRKKTKNMLSGFYTWCALKGYVDVDHLQLDWKLINAMLPPCTNIRNNHPCLDYKAIPEFVRRAFQSARTERDRVTVWGLMLTLLTAQRVGDFLDFDHLHNQGPEADWFSKWKDIDMSKRIWTIQPHYMKVKRVKERMSSPLRIPITNEMAYILLEIRAYWSHRGVVLTEDDWVVPAYNNKSRPHRSGTVRDYIRRMHDESLLDGKGGYFDPYQPGKVATTHGFRSTFQDWCSSQGKSEILVDKALAHMDESKVKQAYQRDDLLEGRRPLMVKWSQYCFSLLKIPGCNSEET